MRRRGRFLWRTWLRGGCRAALAAGLLAAQAPRATLVHAHAGGDVAHAAEDVVHRPDSAAHAHGAGGQRHDHHHHGGHGHAHHGAERKHADELAPHAHVWWLGLEFTTAAPPADGDQDDDGRGPIDGAGRFARLSAEQPSAVSTGGSAPPPAPPPPRVEGACLAAYVQAVARFAVLPALAAPLCDTARHERSGAQLI